MGRGDSLGIKHLPSKPGDWSLDLQNFISGGHSGHPTIPASGGEALQSQLARRRALSASFGFDCKTLPYYIRWESTGG